jgi:hypothetical protein
MRYQSATISGLLVLVQVAGLAAGGPGDRTSAGQRQKLDTAGRGWLNQDLHLTAGVLLNHKLAPGQHLLLCSEGVSLAVGGGRFTAARGLVWISATAPPADGPAGPGYRVQVYLAGRVSSRAGGQGPDTDLTEIVLERDKAMVVQATVRGEVFVTAATSETGDPRQYPLYRAGIAAFQKAGLDVPPAPAPAVRPASAPVGRVEPNQPAAGYTLNLAPLTDVAPKFERTISEEGQEIITVIGRLYIWWHQPAREKPGTTELFELEADSLVAWRKTDDKETAGTDLSATRLRGISDVYVTGNVVFRQGQRTIYADDFYYDLRDQRGLARNVVLKTFDTQRNIPIYIRAKELRQLSGNEFEGREVLVTTSEFWQPQISLEAAQIRIAQQTEEATPGGSASAGGLNVEMKGVRFKYGNVTILGLPTVRSTRETANLPIRSINAGYDGTFGASLETRWYLSRLLGLQEPAGTDSTLSLDYYSKRGPGGGVEINYLRENYFGSFLGYLIDDHGEDRLSRTRRDVDVPEDLRGRLRFLHRQYLPYGWQLTAEASYLSDQNFLEQFFRTEFNVGKEQETLLYLKRLQDNWGLALLGKVRTNDFLNQVEELPSAEYHLTGQSLFDDRFTFFSDSQVSRYRYRLASGGPAARPDDFFWFTGTRNELDWPLTVGRSKIVPFVAGTFGYDDGAGFQATLDNEPAASQDTIWIGEGGVRMAAQPFWAVYPQAESRLLDLHQIRHVIAPTVTAVKYVASDAVAEQRDTLDLEIAQQWQTKRGPADNLRTVNWLEFNTDFVWVNESNPQSAAPDRVIWNEPFIPLASSSGYVVPPLDRRSTDLFGPRQPYVGVDAILRLTDTTSIVGDTYISMETGTIEQADIGRWRLVWPDLSYYIGTRYLRRFYLGPEARTSKALTFAVTYVLDPRYTLVFSDQYDYEINENITTELTLIRKYHRMSLALTFTIDGFLDEQRVVLGLWPQGIPELALGLRRYMGLGASDAYY